VNTYVPIVAYGKQGTVYGMYLQGRTGNIDGLFYQQTNVGASGRLLLHGSSKLIAGVIYHAVATFDGTTVTTYINGLPDVNATYPGVISYPGGATAGLEIGGQALSDAPFPGPIAQVAVYGSALSSPTIVAHYLAGQLLPMTSEPATPSDSFVDSIGINTHLENADVGNFHDYMGAYNPGFVGGPYGGMKAIERL
jgi:Concanavalin A-like lectin/glucanases superfamily